MTVELALKELAEAVKRIINDRIHKYGVNVRHPLRENTLEGSNLQRTMKVTATDDGVALQIADYWYYVAKGWSRTRKDGSFGLYHELVLWALRKHIMVDGYTQNESAMIVAENVWTKMIVWRRPIPGRPFLEPDDSDGLATMLPEEFGDNGKYINKWLDELFEAIINDLNDFFNG